MFLASVLRHQVFASLHASSSRGPANRGFYMAAGDWGYLSFALARVICVADADYFLILMIFKRASIETEFKRASIETE